MLVQVLAVYWQQPTGHEVLATQSDSLPLSLSLSLSLFLSLPIACWLINGINLISPELFSPSVPWISVHLADLYSTRSLGCITCFMGQSASPLPVSLCLDITALVD